MDDNTQLGGISVYPAFFKTIVEPNGRYRFGINITNNEQSPIKVTSSVEKFSQNDNNQNIYELSDAYDEWFSNSEKTIEPGSIEKINIDLDMPPDSDLEKGSYYPAIVLGVTSVSDTENLQIGTEYVIPLYLAVSENYEESVNIERFHVPSFNIGKRVSFDIEISNNGNTYTSPTSYIEFEKVDLLNDENQTRITTIPVVKGDITLLPESQIGTGIEWSRDNFGKYEATLHVLSGNVELSRQSKTFWLIPAESLTFLAGVLLALVLMAISLIGWKIKKKSSK